MRRLWVVASVLCLAGCSSNLNTECEWPPEQPRPLSLSNAADARHLLHDIELAEELSIRFGDERWGPGPSRTQGREDQCFAPLLQQIVDRHGVTLGDVHAARARLDDRGLNLKVNIPAAGFLGLITLFMLRSIGRRFSIAEEPMPALVAIVICSLLAGVLTAGFGRLWEGALEVIRLGNGHLSYRGLRMQWTRHSFAFAVLAAGAFLVTALAHYVAVRIRTPAPTP